MIGFSATVSKTCSALTVRLWRRIRSASCLLFSLTMLTLGCAREPVKPVEDQRPTVLTTFTVLADLAANVAGERLQVRSIVKPGAEPILVAASDVLLAELSGIEQQTPPLHLCYYMTPPAVLPATDEVARLFAQQSRIERHSVASRPVKS